MPLSGKRIIVTGAAGGLGRAFCLHLASQGARVLAADVAEEGARETVARIRGAGGDAIVMRVDVTLQADTQHMASRAFEAWGGIDGVVNNAAIYAGISRRPFDEIPVEEWDQVMSVNAKGPWLCARAVAPYMRKQGHGAIVNVASEVAFSGSYHLSHYVASKAALVGLTRALARELGEWNVRVNALAPGFTDTEASRRLADVAAYDTSRTPLGRLAQPKDMLGALTFFLSDASAFVTGQTLLVNGGRVVQ